MSAEADLRAAIIRDYYKLSRAERDEAFKLLTDISDTPSLYLLLEFVKSV